MGRLWLEHANGHTVVECRRCYTYLSNDAEIESRDFSGSTGKAILFQHAWNLRFGECQQRTMITGAHWVRDVHCIACGTKLGWMYEMACVREQMYKEAKVILECALIVERLGLVDPVDKRHLPVSKIPPKKPQIETMATLKLRNSFGSGSPRGSAASRRSRSTTVRRPRSGPSPTESASSSASTLSPALAPNFS